MQCFRAHAMASGESFRSLQFQFRIGRKTISEIIIDVCRAVIEILGPDHLNTPGSKARWLEIANKFEERWNFPNGLVLLTGTYRDRAAC